MSSQSSCPDEGMLRAYLDQELPADSAQRIRAHLAGCPLCADTLETLRTQAQIVYSSLAAFKVPAPAPAAAWQHFSTRFGVSHHNSLIWRVKAMWRSQSARHPVLRPALAGALALVLVVTLMAITPVRTAAVQFLDIFRVRKFAVLQIDAERAKQLEQYQVKVFSKPDMPKEKPVAVDSAAQASQVAGFGVLIPGTVPNGYSPKGIEVAMPRTATSQVDLVAARQLLKMANLPTDGLPEGKDRIQVTAKLPAVVDVIYESGTRRLEVLQARSPEVDVPDDVDLQRVGELGLQLLGMTAQEAHQVSSRIDWATTLVIPVPSNMAAVQEVPVRGTTGYSFRSSNPKISENVLIWEADGLLYAVTGEVAPAVLLEVAESLKPVA